MVSISVILCTARHPFPIIGMPNLYVLEPTLRSLERQSFRDFELVIVDALYPEKEKWIRSRTWSFKVKYVPVHPNHRFWLDRRMWSICGQLNTGIIHAEGELIVRVDDCSEFESDYLHRFWEGYQSGYLPLAMHIRYLGGRPARLDPSYLDKGYEAGLVAASILRDIYGEGGLIRDSRYQLVQAHGGRMIANPNQYYGYSSVPLEAALRLNGYNECCDGQKGLEDVEFGERLAMAGYGRMFLLDSKLQVVEHEHEPVSWLGSRTSHCNYGIIQYNRRQGLYRANDKPFTLRECEYIRDQICPRCDNLGRCREENLGGRFWVDGQEFETWLSFASRNVFDLAEERLEV